MSFFELDRDAAVRAVGAGKCAVEFHIAAAGFAAEFLMVFFRGVPVVVCGVLFGLSGLPLLSNAFESLGVVLFGCTAVGCRLNIDGVLAKTAHQCLLTDMELHVSAAILAGENPAPIIVDGTARGVALWGWSRTGFRFAVACWKFWGKRSGSTHSPQKSSVKSGVLVAGVCD
jgi:hypothetical protein